MKNKIIFVASHPLTVEAFLSPHIKALNSLTSVQVLANTKTRDLLKRHGVGVDVDFVPLVRPISPWCDIKALWILFRRIKKAEPTAVHTVTPKAGLLGMLAAWLARVPVRTHTFTGQVWVNKDGFGRWLLKCVDKVISILATDRLVDSPSQRRFLIEEGVINQLNSDVLGSGSICGVNTQRFCPDPTVRLKLKAEMGASEEAFVCLFLGRLNKDKGILDLAMAFSRVASGKSHLELWLAGPDEENLYKEVLDVMGPLSCQVRRIDFTNEPERIMQSADLFCLPSYREGFGSSVIEAAAC